MNILVFILKCIFSSDWLRSADRPYIRWTGNWLNVHCLKFGGRTPTSFPSESFVKSDMRGLVVLQLTYLCSMSACGCRSWEVGLVFGFPWIWPSWPQSRMLHNFCLHIPQLLCIPFPLSTVTVSTVVSNRIYRLDAFWIQSSTSAAA